MPAFRADVARVLELVGPNRCVVWATIWRDGAPSDAFNAVLRDAAAANRRVRLVEWAEMVSSTPTGSPATGCTATRRAIASEPGQSPRPCGTARPRDVTAQMTRTSPLAPARTRASATRPRRSPWSLVNGGSAKAVPGTWSATSELLATELAPRFPDLAFVEVRYRIKTWNEFDSCMADARAALDLVARPSLLVGFSMGGAVSIGVARIRTVDRRARPRAVDPGAAVARRAPRQAPRRAPRLLGPLPARDPRRQRRRARGAASSVRRRSASKAPTR